MKLPLPLEQPLPERFGLAQVFTEPRLMPYLRLLLLDRFGELHDDRVRSLAGIGKFLGEPIKLRPKAGAADGRGVEVGNAES